MKNRINELNIHTHSFFNLIILALYLYFGTKSDEYSCVFVNLRQSRYFYTRWRSISLYYSAPWNLSKVVYLATKDMKKRSVRREDVHLSTENYDATFMFRRIPRHAAGKSPEVKLKGFSHELYSIEHFRVFGVFTLNCFVWISLGCRALSVSYSRKSQILMPACQTVYATFYDISIQQSHYINIVQLYVADIPLLNCISPWSLFLRYKLSKARKYYSILLNYALSWHVSVNYPCCISNSLMSLHRSWIVRETKNYISYAICM